MRPNRKEFKVYCDTDYEKFGNKVIDGKSYNVYIEAQLINDEWIYDWFNYNVIIDDLSSFYCPSYLFSTISK